MSSLKKVLNEHWKGSSSILYTVGYFRYLFDNEFCAAVRWRMDSLRSVPAEFSCPLLEIQSHHQASFLSLSLAVSIYKTPKTIFLCLK